MKILIAGDGKVGLALTKQLLREGHDVVVIDTNQAVLSNNEVETEAMAVNGNAAAMDTLIRAGVRDAELLIAATNSDETNILCCLTGRKLNKKIHTIARIRNGEYSKQLAMLHEELGLSMTINPEQSAAREIFRLLQFPDFLKRETFAKGRVELVELKIRPDSKLKDIKLMDLYKIIRIKVLICAVARGNEVIIPSGDFVLKEGDHIYVTAAASDLTILLKNLGITPKEIWSILLVGGGRIGRHLARRLLKAGADVKIIEKNPEQARVLAEEFPKAEVVIGDGTSQSFLQSEGITEADSVVTLTDIDEENLVVSMYANVLGVPKIITKMNRLEYVSVLGDIGIGSVVSPKAICCQEIVRYVRAMQNQKGSIISLHRVANDRAEALEFRVDSSVRHRGIPLKDVPIKKGVLIFAITHNGVTTIPDGNSTFEIGDTVSIITANSSLVQGMNDIFQNEIL